MKFTSRNDVAELARRRWSATLYGVNYRIAVTLTFVILCGACSAGLVCCSNRCVRETTAGRTAELAPGDESPGWRSPGWGPSCFGHIDNQLCPNTQNKHKDLPTCDASQLAQTLAIEDLDEQHVGKRLTVRGSIGLDTTYCREPDGTMRKLGDDEVYRSKQCVPGTCCLRCETGYNIGGPSAHMAGTTPPEYPKVRIAKGANRDYVCGGDESQSCCSIMLIGDVLVTGVLRKTNERNPAWRLDEPVMCRLR